MKEKVEVLSAEDMNFVQLDTPDEQVVCRGQRHKWGEIIPGRPLPRNMDAQPRRDGSFQIVVSCERCGQAERTIYTGAKGVLGESGRRNSYKYGPDWVKAPEGTDTTPRDFFLEALRRAAWEGGGDKK